MTVWLKQGVCGSLTSQTQKGLGRVANLYWSAGEDLMVTAVRDGNHMAGSFHYIGQAFDFRTSDRVPVSEVSRVLGPGWDVVEHKYHTHVEYDPKEG